MKKWKLVWSPKGRQIAVVEATSASAAKKKAPPPYRKYLGEIYAEELKESEGRTKEDIDQQIKEERDWDKRLPGRGES